MKSQRKEIGHVQYIRDVYRGYHNQIYLVLKDLEYAHCPKHNKDLEYAHCPKHNTISPLKTEPVTAGADATIWPRNQTCSVESALAMTDSVFMLRFRLFLGQCRFSMRYCT